MSELTNRSVGMSSAAPAGGAEFAGRGGTCWRSPCCASRRYWTPSTYGGQRRDAAIRNSLHFSEGGLAWMVDAYMVPFGGFLLLGGRTGDLLGRRRVLVAGTAAFAAASLGSALAP